MKHFKILILYASRGGATKYCAELLAEKLKNIHEVCVTDITKSQPAPDEFDVIVLASSIRMGQMNKLMKKYARLEAKHTEALSALTGRDFKAEDEKALLRLPAVITLANALYGKAYSVRERK